MREEYGPRSLPEWLINILNGGGQTFCRYHHDVPLRVDAVVIRLARSDWWVLLVVTCESSNNCSSVSRELRLTLMKPGRQRLSFLFPSFPA